MKMLWKLTKEAARYKGLYILAIVSTLCLTAVNLAAPKVLSTMTGVVEKGLENTSFSIITGTLSAADSFPVFKQLSGA